MIIPTCPLGHGEMKKVEITQGGVILGYAWFCVMDDCREAEDYIEDEHESYPSETAVQYELFA